jgi:hypothetical protein
VTLTLPLQHNRVLGPSTRLAEVFHHDQAHSTQLASTCYNTYANHKQVRTGIQLAGLITVVFLLVFFLDNRYRVLPTAVHNHMPLHHEGLVMTDLTIQTCSAINPLSKCMLDQKKWHRVEKDLYLGQGWVQKAYVHVKRKREEELTAEDKVIVDVRIGKLDPATGEKEQAAERWESRPAGVWLKRSLKRHASDSKRAVTAVDILFGADAVEPRPGWELVKNGALHLDAAKDAREPRITIRRGRVEEHTKPVPKIRKDGKFKIMQISDLHLSTGLGVCRDPEPKGANGGHCEADPRTLEFVERVLDEEKPDLVVLSGDQVNGGTAPDVQSVGTNKHLSCLSLTLFRPCSRSSTHLLSARFRTQRSLEITTMRERFPAALKCLSTSPCLIH